MCDIVPFHLDQTAKVSTKCVTVMSQLLEEDKDEKDDEDEEKKEQDISE